MKVGAAVRSERKEGKVDEGKLPFEDAGREAVR